jgi:hypothetical protein
MLWGIMTHHAFRSAYDQFLGAVTGLLYDFDPDGIGRSIDAPLDEYRDLATRLVPRLSRSATASEAAKEIRKLVPTAEPTLIEALWAAQQKFKENTSTGSSSVSSYDETMQGQLRALLITTGTRISPEQLSLFNELVDANEPGVALDMLSEALATSGTRIDETLFRDMQSLAEQMKLKPEVVDQLRPLVE